MKRTALLLYFLLLYTGYTSAQYTSQHPPIIFRHLTQADGLSSNVVNCILQDRYGFMWFGTNKGLNRYDGRSIVLYSRHEQNTNSLSGNNITALYEDKKGRIWIGTNNNGITVYDPITQRFKRYEHNTKDKRSINEGYVAQVYEDGAGRYWICLYGGGLELFDEKTGTFIHHTWRANDSTSIAGNKVKSIYELSPGKYLVGTFEAGGDFHKDMRNFGFINYYDLRTNSFKPLHIGQVLINKSYMHKVFIMERLVHTIFRDSAGYIWFGTYSGIIRYNPLNGHSIAYKHSDDDSTTLSNEIVRSICELDGRLYFGTEGGGLNILDTATGKFINYKNDPLNPNSLSDDFIKVVYKDKEKRLWIGTIGGGINIIDPINSNFKVYPYQYLKILPNTRVEDVTIHALCPVGKNTLLIGSGSGLTILNTITDEVKLIQKKHKQDSRIVNSSVFAIHPSALGHYWVGIHSEIYKFNPETHNLSFHSREMGKKTTHLAILSIIETPDSSLLVNTFGKFTWRLKPDNSVDSVSNRIKGIAVKDKDGDLWARYYFKDNADGVISIDKNWRIKQHSFAYNSNNKNYPGAGRIHSLYIDSKNRLWISCSNGLYSFDKKTERFRQYKNIVNFPDTSINSMTEDGDNNKWFLTNDALLKMDSSGKVTTYETYKDIPVHKPESKIIYDDAQDAIYFAANEGLVRFYPKKLNLNQTIQSIYITGFKLFNKPVQTDSSWLLKRNYHFKHNENLISITFSTINYSNLVSHQYEYKLEGLNNSWIQAGSNNEANFTNLSPGVYVLKIRGSSHQGTWNYESAPITIVISKPWWQTTWFYISCIAAVVLILYGYNRYRTNSFKRRTEKLEKMVEQRTAQYREQKEYAENSERLRQQFLANMSHEIRTPINAVSGLTQLLLEKNPDPSQISYLQAISKSSDMLRHIVNDILDLSKIEAGKLQLEAINFSISDIAGRVHDILSFAASQKGLSLTLDIDDDIPETIIGDPFRISQVLLNLCGNAIKFTEKGSVAITVKQVHETQDTLVLNFSVTDTGIGIPEDKLQNLFKDFAQINPSDTRKHGGTGLGLSISKNLVTLMGGELTAKSYFGKGSVFSFSVPVKKGNIGKAPENDTVGVVDTNCLNGLHILIADDNEYNRLVLLDTLHLKANVTIDAATTGAEAITSLKNKHYDVILMDVQMPVMSGIEATRKIRSEFPAPKNMIPIIALTASTQYADRDMCLQAGMNAVIIKPFNASHLLTTIIQAITGKNAHTSNTIDIQETTTQSNNVTDLTYLTDFCENNQERMKQYIQLYIQAVPVFNNKITAALHANDTETIAELIHAFKPKWVMMGMHRATTIAGEIEQARENGIENLKEFVEALLNENEKSLLALNK